MQSLSDLRTFWDKFASPVSGEAEKSLISRGATKEVLNEFQVSSFLQAPLVENQTIRTWLIHWTPETLIFPLTDVGLFWGWMSRSPGERDFYVCVPFKTISPYWFGRTAKVYPGCEVILVEGARDCLAVASKTEKIVLACGTAGCSKSQKRWLKRWTSKVFLMYDRDEAGRDATKRDLDYGIKEGISILSVDYPRKDPAELLEKDPRLFVKLLKDL